MAPPIKGIVETCIYTDDLPSAQRFYAEVLGLKLINGDDRFCAFAVAPGQVLLIFVTGSTPDPIAVEHGVIPPHDGSGAMHIGFAVSADDLAAWEEALAEAGIAIESRATWPRGGKSVYFRDPDNHLVELLTPGLWTVY